MQMQETRNDGAVIALQLAGRLDLAGVGEIETAFKQKSAEAGKGLLLECSQLSFLASLGMRMLMMAAKTMQAKGGKIVIISPQEEVENALRMSGLDQVIPIVTSESAAVAQLG